MLRADRFRDLRLKHEYTHEELAELLEIGTRQIARYESTETVPSAEILARIAKLFGVTSDYLLGLSEEPTPRVDEGDLSEQERKIIAALRDGDRLEAIKEIIGVA